MALEPKMFPESRGFQQKEPKGATLGKAFLVWSQQWLTQVGKGSWPLYPRYCSKMVRFSTKTAQKGELQEKIYTRALPALNMIWYFWVCPLTKVLPVTAG